MVQDVQQALVTIGLSLNVTKTAWAGTPTVSQRHANFCGVQVGRSDTIQFLGNVFRPSSPGGEDMIPRINKAYG
eukprot:4626783-Amphidinium_carterae.1